MGQPVVHFEVVGKDGEKLHRYYSELFGWEIQIDNAMNYGMVAREGNVGQDGVGIGGGVGQGPEGYDGHVTFYVAVGNDGDVDKRGVYAVSCAAHVGRQSGRCLLRHGNRRNG